MKHWNRIFFVIIYLFSLPGWSQELPPIQNFSPLDYEAGNQNWSISQSKDKLIYVANNEGLLEFNGARWSLYPSPNETIMRSVKVIGDKIYGGYYMEFGYWKKTPLGILEYTSLSEQLNITLLEDEEFWNILGIDEWIIFQSLNRIYIYDTQSGTVRTIDSKDVIVKMFEVNESVYFQRKNKGLYKIENGKDILILNNPIFKTDEVINLFNEGKGLIILTKNNGFYTYEDERLEKWSIPGNVKLINRDIYSAIQLRDQSFALGTISDGLLYLNRQRGLIYSIDQNNGLNNNTVLSIFEDGDNNIWSGLDNGLSYININAPIRVFKDNKGILGSVYSSAIHDGKLYFGTNQGLFYKSLSGQEDLQLVNGTQGQVWCLKVLDGTLFCGHHKGTFAVKGNTVIEVADIQGTWSMDRVENPDNLIIQGNYDGLYVLEKKGGKWQLRNKLKGFNNSSRHFELLDNQLFVNHEYKGIFQMSIDESFTSVRNITIDTLLKGANSGIAKYNGNILYASKNGIYNYNRAENAFVKDSTLSNIYTENTYTSGRMIPTEEKNRFWIFTKENITLVSSGNLANVPTTKTIPLTSEVRRDVTEYENIISTEKLNQYVLGTSSGYLTVDVDDLAIKDFSVYITEISNGINQDHSASGDLIDQNQDGSFSPDENNFRISFHTPEFYKYFKPTYQFQLVGLYEVWSEWTSSSTVFFENLPAGNYSFNVRAKIGDKLSDNVATYNFHISKPWYITNFMVAIYVLCVILFSIFMHNVYRRYYKGQQQRLIEENQRELELTKLQNEKEIIKLKNDQLQRDVKSKSKELAASTMSIIKKNELLTQIKEQLAKVEDRNVLSPVVKIIDRNLNHNENWELFKEAFNNADSEFFKKMQELHPDLSPNDLKLCAYLRLNLSSKEIAPLFNISPRSVEIKRYRLRKKLDLDNNENLTNYILSI